MLDLNISAPCWRIPEPRLFRIIHDMKILLLIIPNYRQSRSRRPQNRQTHNLFRLELDKVILDREVPHRAIVKHNPKRRQIVFVIRDPRHVVTRLENREIIDQWESFDVLHE
ncbi:hypothetical protein Hanom_Chr06g00510351 [Helianthus anomalus]